MRNPLLFILVVLVACGDDDSSIEPDAGRDSGRDAGRDAGSDASSDTSTDVGTDVGTDAPVDAFDAGPTLCDPVASDITFPSREWNAEVVADGSEFDEPAGIAFNGDTLLIANSPSWVSASTEAGNVLQVIDGTVSVFASDATMLGPAFAVWHPGDASGFPEGLYMGIEDAIGPGVLQISTDGSSVTTLANGAEPGELEIGIGGDWGDDLYVTSRERADSVMPNPFDVYTVTPAGDRTRFDVTGLAGAYALEFGPGGAFGDDLYVGTIEDPGFSPGSEAGLYRVASDGTATDFVESTIVPLSIAAPAVLDGEFGVYLYVATPNGISRVDATGSDEILAEGIIPAGMKFGPDGALYVADPRGARVLRITRCP